MVTRKDVRKKQATVKLPKKRPTARATRLHPAPLQQATALSEKLRQQAAVLEQAHLDAKRHADAAASVTAALLDQHLTACEAPPVTLRTPPNTEEQAREHETRVALIEKQLAEREVEQVKVDPWVEPDPVRRSFWQWLMGR